MQIRARITALIAALVHGNNCLGCQNSSSTRVCATCHEALLTLDAAPQAVWVDRPPIARMVRRAKEGQWRRCAPFLTRYIQMRCAGELSGVDLITFVPADFWRKRARGGHLPEQVAKRLGRDLGVPVASLLRRRMNSTTQRGLQRDLRRSNAAKSFRLHRRAANRLHRQSTHRALTIRRPLRILLIDDVRTTGSTLQENGRLLGLLGGEVIPLALVGVSLMKEG